MVRDERSKAEKGDIADRDSILGFEQRRMVKISALKGIGLSDVHGTAWSADIKHEETRLHIKDL